MLGFLLVPTLLAAQNTSSEDEMIGDIIQYLSFEDRLNESPQTLNEEFSQNPLGLTNEQNQQMMDLFMNAFTADTLRENARRVFHDNFNKEHAQTVLKQLEEGTLENAIRAEQVYFTIQGTRKSVVYRYELEQDPPSEERIELIGELAENMSAADAEVESQVILIRAIITAFGVLSSQQSLTDSQIENFVNNYRGQIESQINEEIRNQFLVRYYELDNEILKNYRSFYDSEAGTWLIETTHKALQESYEKASNRFIDSIREL